MITYTKRNVSILALIMAILLCSFFHLLYFKVTTKFQNNLSKNQVYSRIISIQSITNNSEITQNSKLQTIPKVNQETKTQRQIVQENKNIEWRIQIPKINLDVHIKEGTSLEVMLHSVGHFEETSKWNGNVGLAAHNRGYQCNFFQNIKNLKQGDEIIYTTTKGKKVYRVQTNKVILETDWSYLEETKNNCITLITCEENRKEYRRCIQAVEIANYQNKI